MYSTYPPNKLKSYFYFFKFTYNILIIDENKAMEKISHIKISKNIQNFTNTDSKF